jgi:hypothetical protein
MVDMRKEWQVLLKYKSPRFNFWPFLQEFVAIAFATFGKTWIADQIKNFQPP